MSSLPAVELVVKTITTTILDNEQYFSDLDQVAGDGDMGITLARGFAFIRQDFDSYDRTSIGAFLKKIGFAISAKVGKQSLVRGLRAVNKYQTKGSEMKKFVNDPKQFVPEMLKGIALANSQTLKYVPAYNLIMCADAPNDDKVPINELPRGKTRTRVIDTPHLQQQYLHF